MVNRVDIETFTDSIHLAKVDSNMPKTRREETRLEEPPSKRSRPNWEEVNETGDSVDFTLKVAHGEELEVSKTQSEKLQDACDFFRNAFRHGTLECQDRVISKPDWTLDTAVAILNLLQNRSISIPDDYAAFKEAADQILLSLRVSHPITGNDMHDDGEWVQATSQTWNAATTTFTLDLQRWILNRPNPRSLDAIWGDLLQSGTVFVDQNHDNLKVQLSSTENAPTNLVPAKTLFRSVQLMDLSTQKSRAIILINEPKNSKKVRGVR